MMKERPLLDSADAIEVGCAVHEGFDCSGNGVGGVEFVDGNISHSEFGNVSAQ